MSGSDMRRVCAWCGVVLEAGVGTNDASHPVSHGICLPCARKFLEPAAAPSAREFLDGLGVPILVVDDDVRVSGANRQAAALLGKSVRTLVGLKGGDAIECLNAQLPGGCGKSPHCRGCAIRNTVRTTHETGAACTAVVAYADVDSSTAPGRLCLSISTEKVGEVVLLRIDSLDEAPAQVDR